MMRRLHLALFIPVLCLMSLRTHRAFAQTTRSAGQGDAVLSGTVSDPAGARVADATVIAIGPITRSTVTDRQGLFSLRVPRGAYEIQIVKPGFATYAQSIAIDSNASELTFTLALAGVSDSVVVSASAVERSLRDAPASISVITSEQLETRPVRDVSEVLATVEGLTLRRSGNTVPTVQVRGLDGAYTLMLIDGQRVTATSASFRGNDYDTGWVPADAIERIEVVRGPMSSLYGSDAIGGVVNIITKRAGPRWRGSVGGSGTFQENSNAGDAWMTSVSTGGPLVRNIVGIKAYGGLDRREADGTVNPQQPNGGAPLPGFPVNDNRFFSTELGWIADRHHDMSFRFDGSRRDHGGFLLTRRAGSFVHRGTWNGASSEVKVYGDEIRNLVGTVTGQINPNRSNNVTVDGKVSVPFGRHVITAGGEHRYQALDDPANLAGLPGTPTFGQDSKTSVRQSAAFVEADIAALSRLRLTAGNRFDHHENFGGHHSPRAYAVYHVTPLVTVKGGVSRAFRAPTLLQNSPNWGSPSCGNAVTGCFIIGSRELEPETSTSGEIGVQLDRGPIAAGLTVYRNDLKNMIDITNRTNDAALAPTLPNFVGFLPPGPPGYGRPIFRYQNINSVRTQGVEVMLRGSIATRLSIRGNYAYLEAENRSAATSLPLIYRPTHTVNVSADWTAAARLTVSAVARFTSDQVISVPANGQNVISRDGYTIVDLSAGYRAGSHLTLRGGVLNLGDTQLFRETSVDFNEEGRRYFVAFTTRF